MLNQNEERLQKVLARAGIASRRACEELIEEGRVRVNGKIVTQLGLKVNPAQDKVSVDEHPIPIRSSLTPARVYLLLNKPVGYLSTVTDPQGRPTIMELVETDQRLYPVGRLDMDTEGLLILTNDGTFANTLMHPRYGLEKEYLALLDGIPAVHELEQLRRGLAIPVENEKTGEREYYTTQPARVEIVRNEGSNTLVRFVIKEGKKRQIRLMTQAIHRPVLTLTRVGYGTLRLGNLEAGKYRPLSNAEVKSLMDAASREPAGVRKPYSRPATGGHNARSAGATMPPSRPSRRSADSRPGSKPTPRRSQFTPFASSDKPKLPGRSQATPFAGSDKAKRPGRNQPAVDNDNVKRPLHSRPAGFRDSNNAKPERPSRGRPAAFRDNADPSRPSHSRPAPFVEDDSDNEKPQRPIRGKSSKPFSFRSGPPNSRKAPTKSRGNYKPSHPTPTGKRRSPKGR